MFRIGDLAKKIDNQRLYLVVNVNEKEEECELLYIYDNPNTAQSICCAFSELTFISHIEVI